MGTIISMAIQDWQCTPTIIMPPKKKKGKEKKNIQDSVPMKDLKQTTV